MRKATIATLAGAALALASCQSTTGGIDTAIRNNLPATCRLIQTGYDAFAVIALTGNIKPATVRKVETAYAATQLACANPENVTAANALIIAAGAYATITVALKEAKAVEARP